MTEPLTSTGGVTWQKVSEEDGVLVFRKRGT
jgi:hypothetical protein